MRAGKKTEICFSSRFRGNFMCNFSLHEVDSKICLVKKV